MFDIRKPTDWGVGTPYQQFYIAIMNAPQTPTDHKAYIYQECRFGGVKDRSSMVRMPRPMFAHLGTIARQNNSDISTVIRQAVYEYLQARGFKPFTQL